MEITIRKLLLSAVVIVFIPLYSFSQETYNNNGLNLESYCQGTYCKHIYYFSPIHYPNVLNIDWQIENFEIAIKKNGHFLATGDMHITGADAGAIVQLEFLFVDIENRNLHRHMSEKFEFFNDPDHAEPVVFRGQIPEGIFPEVNIVDVEVRFSKLTPSYELSTSCYLPCKEVALKDAIKAFRKSK